MPVTLRNEIKNVSKTTTTTNIPQTKAQPSPKQLCVTNMLSYLYYWPPLGVFVLHNLFLYLEAPPPCSSF
jgi:hypothetical protein